MNHKRHASSISGFFSVSHPFFYFGILDNQQSSTTLQSGSPEPPLWLRHPGSFRSTACSDPLDGQAETLRAARTVSLEKYPGFLSCGFLAMGKP